MKARTTKPGLATPMGIVAREYLRVSRDKSGRERSPEEQHADNVKAADRRGWALGEPYRDVGSASRSSRKVRKDFEALMSDIEAGRFGAQILILWESSRGSRRVSEWVKLLEACQDHGIQIYVTADSKLYDPAEARDRRSLLEDSIDAEYEAAKHGKRVKRAQAANAEAGRPYGRRCYGYVRIYDEKTGDYVREEPHREHADIVTDIFTRFTGGETITAIARRLHHAGAPLPDRALKGGKPLWRPSTVRKILRTQRYAAHPDNPEKGTIVYGDQIYPATWPPLVPREVWRMAQDILGADNDDKRRFRKYQQNGVRYLLSGSVDLLRSPCGSIVAGQAAIPSQHRSARYLCVADKCSSISMAETDEFVVNAILGRIAEPDIRNLWESDQTETQKALARLAELERDLAKNEAEYAKGRISARLAGVREQELQREIDELRPKTRPTGMPSAAVALLEAVRLRKELRPVWDALPLTARRELVADLFAELRITPVTTRITRRTTPEERRAMVVERIVCEWREP